MRKGAIYEPLCWLFGPEASIYDQLGIVPQGCGTDRAYGDVVSVAEVLEYLRKGSVEEAAE